MNEMKVGWIGFGNMAKAMAQGLIGSGSIAADDLYACARDQQKLAANTAALGMHACKDSQELVSCCDLEIVAVKPYQVKDVLMPLRDALQDKIVLSVAAGMPFDVYEELLAPDTAHISTIPNTPIAAQAGVIVCEARHSLNAKQLTAVKALFDRCALLVFVDSEQLSVAGTISGCGPAFACMMVEALADAGVKHGLQRTQAYQLAAGMIKGSGALLLQSGEHPAALKDAVCSPKGTTIRGVAALEENGFRHALIAAVDAAEQKE